MFTKTFLFIFPALSLTLHTPCGNVAPGKECLLDEECYGETTRCFEGVCTCQVGFEGFIEIRKLDNGLEQRQIFCRPAPDKVGEKCQSECKPPLICRDGICECWQADFVNGTCVIDCGENYELIGQDCLRVAKLNQPCRIEKECVDPFATCDQGICRCTNGTEEQNGECVAACPDGSFPLQTCTRLFVNDVDMLDHSGQTDSCPAGYQCMTYGKPLIGQCCKTVCPYGEADLTKSCASGVSFDKRCRDITHFCHKIESPGWTTSVCCPRPCRQPRPHLVDGKCTEQKHLRDRCENDAHCDAHMECRDNRCQCITGYLPFTRDLFPTCIKACPIGTINTGTLCMSKVGLGQACVIDAQCPVQSRCYMGRCSCRCGKKPGEFLTQQCVEPSKEDLVNIKSFADELLSPGFWKPKAGESTTSPSFNAFWT